MTGHITELASGYIDGTLPPKMMEKVKSHLFFCNHCRNIVRELQENVQRLKNLPAREPPKELEEKIILALKREMKSAEVKKSDFWHPLKSWFFSYKGMALAATAALAIVYFKAIPPHLKSGFWAPEKEQRRTFSSKTAEKLRRAQPQSMAEKSIQHDMDKISPAEKENLKDLAIPSRAAGPLKKEEKQEPADNVQGISQVDETKGMGSSFVGGVPQGKGMPSQLEYTPGVEHLAHREAVQSAKKSEGLRSATQNKLPLYRTPTTPEIWGEIKGDSSGITEPFHEVISDLRSWQRIWNRHGASQEPKPPLPPVNFDTNEVIFICAGSKPTGGYSMDIVNIQNTEWEGKPARIIHYQLRTPPENSMNITVITQPFVFHLVPKIQGTTFFKTPK